MDKLPIKPEHVEELSITEPRYGPRDRVEYGLEIGSASG